jgi:hypothetical protein
VTHLSHAALQPHCERRTGRPAIFQLGRFRARSSIGPRSTPGSSLQANSRPPSGAPYRPTSNQFQLGRFPEDLLFQAAEDLSSNHRPQRIKAAYVTYRKSRTGPRTGLPGSIAAHTVVGEQHRTRKPTRKANSTGHNTEHVRPYRPPGFNRSTVSLVAVSIWDAFGEAQASDTGRSTSSTGEHGRCPVTVPSAHSAYRFASKAGRRLCISGFP